VVLRALWLIRGSDTYYGIAYLVHELSCGDDTSGAYDCIMPRTDVAGYMIGWEPLSMPHTSYVHSCTLNSFNSTSLVLSSYEIDTSDSAIKTGSFKIFNPATLDSYELHDMKVQDDGVWHKCEVAEMPWQLIACEYVLDRGTNYIGFRFEWFCDDRDPSHAYVLPSKKEKKKKPLGDHETTLI
jgi:hypothetical protein